MAEIDDALPNTKTTVELPSEAEIIQEQEKQKLLEILEEWKWFNNEIVIPPRRESFDRKKNVTTIK